MRPPAAGGARGWLAASFAFNFCLVILLLVRSAQLAQLMQERQQVGGIAAEGSPLSGHSGRRLSDRQMPQQLPLALATETYGVNPNDGSVIVSRSGASELEVASAADEASSDGSSSDGGSSSDSGGSGTLEPSSGSNSSSSSSSSSGDPSGSGLGSGSSGSGATSDASQGSNGRLVGGGLRNNTRRGRAGSKTATTLMDPECVPHPKCVFIVATGRSGSTNVMDALNQIPGVFVRGENGGILNFMVDIHSLVQDLEWWPTLHRKRLKGPAHEQYAAMLKAHLKPAFFNGFPKGSAKCISRMLFRKLFAYGEYSDYMVGFKEIRYMPTHTSPAASLKMFKFKRFAPPIMGYADFKRHMSLLRGMCKDTKLVFNVRQDTSGQLSSGHFKGGWAESNGWDKHLETSAAWMSKYASANPNHSFMMYHEELFNPEVNGTVAANLLRFLGKPEDTPIDFARIDRKWCCD